MSRSDPPPSPTAARRPRSDRAPARPLRRRAAIRLAAWMRWLHIYTSMIGLGATLFFGVTGLTLNHPSWFTSGEALREEAEGRLPADWVAPNSPVKKLEIVERLRSAHGARGALAEFREDDLECLVTFKGPGYAADAFIDRETGRYELTQTSQGFVAVINDLHKGRDAGPVWSVVIDVSAVLLAVISLTGLGLLFYLKLRRKPGVIVAVIGAAAVAALAVFWSP